MWESDLDLCPKETGNEDVEWVDVALDQVQCQTVANTVMTLRIP